MSRRCICLSLHWLLFSGGLTLLVLLNFPVNLKHPTWVSAQGLYASHNFCISHEVDYKMELFADEFTVNETIILRPLENLYECYVHAEKFDVNEITAASGQWGKQMENFEPILQLLPHGVYSVRRTMDRMWSLEEDYRITFTAKKSFSKVGEGLTFKIYRDMATFKR